MTGSTLTLYIASTFCVEGQDDELCIAHEVKEYLASRESTSRCILYWGTTSKRELRISNVKV
jgi:hypothetical protein